MNNIRKNHKHVVLVAHKFLTQPDDDLTSYLNAKHYQSVLHICHSFIDALDRKSSYRLYQEGKLVQEHFSFDYKGFPEPLLYLKEFAYTFWWVWTLGRKWDAYIGMDGLCVLFGNVLRMFGKVKRTIFWAIDFVPEARFSSKLKNWIYHTINTHGYEHSDEMWDLSPRMAEARQKYLGFPESKYKVRRLVPYGSWTNRIRRYSWAKCKKHQLVFMGILLEKQGVQLVLQAIPHIVKKIPDFHFVIIGGGPYREKLEELVKELGIKKFCTFTGKIPDHQKLEKKIAESGVAIAPYIAALDTWTYYADPGKVKTYLACGVPVLLTDLPWNAHDIEKKAAGKIISENSKKIAKVIIDMMQQKNGQTYRKNATQFAQSFSYDELFKSAENYL
jgi:glycosyltransferase involved in cell wall biosynthesis